MEKKITPHVKLDSPTGSSQNLDPAAATWYLQVGRGGRDQIRVVVGWAKNSITWEIVCAAWGASVCVSCAPVTGGFA